MAHLSHLVLLLQLALYCAPDLIDAAHSATVAEHSSPNEQSNKTYPSPDESVATLGRIKLGLAAAFFFCVLIACGLPIVLIDWLQKKESPVNRSAANNSPFRGDRSAADPEDDNADSPRETPSQNGTGPHRDSWARVGPIHKSSTGSEPLSIPSPSHAENTDLLTGTVVNAGSGGWRQYHHNLDVDRHLGRSSMQHLRSRRCPSRLLSRSSTSHKLLLQLWFSRFNCFAAGIFLSSGFMELYVDVEESIEVAKTQLHVNSEFPFAPFLTLIGFFMVLSIEQIILTVRAVKQSPSHPDVHVSSPRSPQAPPPPLSRESDMNKFNESVVESPLTAVSPLNTDTHFLFTDEVVLPATPTTPLHEGHPHLYYRRPIGALADHNEDMEDDSDPNGMGQMARRPSKPQYSLPPPQKLQHNYHTHHHHHHHSHLPDADSLTSFGSLLQVIVLLCAMSVHSLFEGLAVGLQSTVQHTLALFSAILLHKLIIAASIGVNLATATTHESPGDATTTTESVVSRRVLVYQALATVILAGSSPLGVLIGWGLMRQDQQSGPLLMSTAILQGLACGTFFFVVFCELLPTEFRDGVRDRLGKLFFLVLGFLLVALYSFFMPH